MCNTIYVPVSLPQFVDTVEHIVYQAVLRFVRGFGPQDYVFVYHTKYETREDTISVDWENKKVYWKTLFYKTRENQEKAEIRSFKEYVKFKNLPEKYTDTVEWVCAGEEE